LGLVLFSAVFHALPACLGFAAFLDYAQDRPLQIAMNGVAPYQLKSVETRCWLER
jgi:hypothetical protein